MKRNKSILAALCGCALTALLAGTLAAGPGKTGCQFLKITPSARAAGMAGAFAGIADDVFALSANPAGLASLEKAGFAATYLRYVADINFGFVGYASPLKGGGVMGFGYTYLIVEGIEKRDVNETRLGDFNAKDTSLSLSCAVRDVAPSLLEGLDFGGSVKVISSEIDQTIAYTAAVDLAAMYRPAEKLAAALAVQNISPGIRFREVTDPLPLNVRLGLTYRHSERLTVAGEIDEYLIDNKAYAALGCEYCPVPQLALRGGYRFGYDTASLGSQVGFAAGMGFRIWSVGLDYAFIPFGDLGDTHRVSFSARF